MKGIYEIQFMKDPLRPGLPASKPTLPNQKDLKLVSLKKQEIQEWLQKDTKG